MVSHSNEERTKARLAALNSYHILDTEEEVDFDELTDLATIVCQMPIALVSLADEKRQWFKAHTGLDLKEVANELSFCSLLPSEGMEIVIVEDTSQDLRLRNNPYVTGSLKVLFYAGVPLIDQGGHFLGTLCVLDHKKNSISSAQQKALKIIAKQVIGRLELRKKIIELQQSKSQLEVSNRALAASNENQRESNEQLFSSNERLFGMQDKLETSFAKLNHSESRLRYLLADAPVAIAVLAGPKMIVESANKKVLEAWGKGQNIVGMPLEEALPELVGQEFFQILKDVYSTGEPFYGYEIPALLRQQGALHDVYSNFVYQPLQDENGLTDSIIITANVVTEQVLARKKIEQADQLMRMSIDAAGLGSWAIDPLNGVFSYNRKLAEIFGYSAMENLTFAQVIKQVSIEFRPLIEEQINEAIESGGRYDITYSQHRFDDNTLIWLRSLGKVHEDEKGRKTFAGFVMDITEQKKDEERKSDFIGMVSHELKTPLTSLTGYLQMLQQRTLGGDSFIPGVLERAVRQAGKMKTLINGFLNVSRLESGKIYIEKQRFDMAFLVKESEEETRALINSHSIIFAPVEETFVFADKDKIGQVISNFISNAVKYSPRGSKIQVACVTQGDDAVLSVSDRGLGIKQEDISRLFERYYRVEGDHTISISGFGIGLYLSAEIINRHQGRIWVESEPGNGSTFFFSLPIVN